MPNIPLPLLTYPNTKVNENIFLTTSNTMFGRLKKKRQLTETIHIILLRA